MKIATDIEQNNINASIRKIGESARAASRILARADTATKNNALNAAADAIRAEAVQIERVNASDIAYAEEQGLNSAQRDR